MSHLNFDNTFTFSVKPDPDLSVMLRFQLERSRLHVPFVCLQHIHALLQCQIAVMQRFTQHYQLDGLMNVPVDKVQSFNELSRSSLLIIHKVGW